MQDFDRRANQVLGVGTLGLFGICAAALIEQKWALAVVVAAFGVVSAICFRARIRNARSRP
jgi:hypothetical protein